MEIFFGSDRTDVLVYVYLILGSSKFFYKIAENIIAQ